MKTPLQKSKRLLLRKISDYEHNTEGKECICVPRIIHVDDSDGCVISHNSFVFLPADYYEEFEEVVSNA